MKTKSRDGEFMNCIAEVKMLTEDYKVLARSRVPIRWEDGEIKLLSTLEMKVQETGTADIILFNIDAFGRCSISSYINVGFLIKSETITLEEMKWKLTLS